MDKVLLFIPCYNCENQITRVLEKVSAYSDYFNEILIVNNISTDHTEQVAISTIKQLTIGNAKVVRNHSNYGLGGSHKAAFNYAIENNFDYVVVLHGDDQGNLSDIMAQLKNDKHKQNDCLLGARFMSGSKLVGYSKFRTFGNFVYNLLFSVVVRFPVKDLGSGLNCYDVKMLKNKFYIKFPDNLTFNYCMVMAIQYHQQKFIFFPIQWSEDDQVSNVKLFSQARLVLEMLWHYLIDRSRFMNEEHREIKHNSYTFDIVG
jgi:glycosyltransferase involved in cell wall biosynthesis